MEEGIELGRSFSRPRVGVVVMLLLSGRLVGWQQGSKEARDKREKKR